MKNIFNFIQNRQSLFADKIIDEKDLLLGTNPKKIVRFFTFKELYKDSKKIVDYLNKKLFKSKTKLIINGNLSDSTILKLIEISIRQKKMFSVIVRDGYQLMKRKNLVESENLAIILESDE